MNRYHLKKEGMCLFLKCSSVSSFLYITAFQMYLFHCFCIILTSYMVETSSGNSSLQISPPMAGLGPVWAMFRSDGVSLHFVGWKCNLSSSALRFDPPLALREAGLISNSSPGKVCPLPRSELCVWSGPPWYGSRVPTGSRRVWSELSVRPLYMLWKVAYWLTKTRSLGQSVGKGYV